MTLARSIGPALLSLVAALTSSACGTSSAVEAGPPPCDQACQDNGAARAVRETMKLVYNLTLQGKPVGRQDATVDCPNGGRARVYGEATSNADQGTTAVTLTYELAACAYTQRDDDVDETYAMTLSGTLTQVGVLAVQPGSSTALVMKSPSLALGGTVYEPAIAYRGESCVVAFTQNGNRLSGTVCGRPVGLDL
ncbi:MAG: hypothetical protein IPF92_20040 [Myxococcales bacterium]|nr:hypothetical protein [Myxococcales bacterium]